DARGTGAAADARGTGAAADARGTGAAADARGADSAPAPPRPEHILALKAPFTSTPQEIYKSADAMPNFTFFENGHWLLLGGGGRGGRGGGGGGGARGGAGAANRIQKTQLV